MKHGRLSETCPTPSSCQRGWAWRPRWRARLPHPGELPSEVDQLKKMKKRKKNIGYSKKLGKKQWWGWMDRKLKKTFALGDPGAFSADARCGGVRLRRVDRPACQGTRLPRRRRRRNHCRRRLPRRLLLDPSLLVVVGRDSRRFHRLNRKNQSNLLCSGASQPPRPRSGIGNAVVRAEIGIRRWFRPCRHRRRRFGGHVRLPPHQSPPPPRFFFSFTF